MAFPLNLRHMEGIAAIRRTGSFSAAAAAINLTQSALTQGVAAVERQLACRLFDRGARGAVPTTNGALLADGVERALRLLNLAAMPFLAGSRHTMLTGFATGTQLRALVAVDRTGSIRGAARASDLTEASIHRAVRDLEAMLGTTLVVRAKSGVALTEAGHAIARATRHALTEFEAAFEAARSGQPCPLVIGAMPLVRAGLLPSAISQLCRQRHGLRLRVVEGAYPELLEGLLEGRLDLLLGALRDPVPDGAAQHHLFQDDLVIAARTDHPLARSGVWDAQELARFPWAASPPGTPRRTRWEDMLRMSGVEPPAPQVECSSASAVRGLLLHGNWLAMLSPDQFRIERELGLLTPLGGPLATSSRPIGITVRAGWKPDPNQSLLLEILARCADDHQPPSPFPADGLIGQA